MSKTTKVMKGEEYKGNKMFIVASFTDDKRDQYPVVSMGLKKAKAVLENIEALKAFVKENE